MRITKLTWAFDPIRSSIPAVNTQTGRWIWGMIRTNHIVDQYFNDSVFELVRMIREKPPEDAKELHSMAFGAGLGCFGIIPDDEQLGRWGTTRPDMEFWGQVFNVITGKETIEEEFK